MRFRGYFTSVKTLFLLGKCTSYFYTIPKRRFGCKNVTFVGDRGMIKSEQIEKLQEHDFHYITAITKQQIKTLIKRQVIQYELFDEVVSEIKEDGIRYILRRNPVRAKEIENSRNSKQNTVEILVRELNGYLKKHLRERVITAVKKVEAKISKLQAKDWLSVEVQERTLTLRINKEALGEESKLNGCYVIKTDLAQNDVRAEIIHDRYKDLAFVESAFRKCAKSNATFRVRLAHHLWTILSHSYLKI